MRTHFTTDYRRDLTPDNCRTTPLLCCACKVQPGIVWRKGALYCYDCDAASRPVHLDDATIAAALMAEQPVITARHAIAALERSAKR